MQTRLALKIGRELLAKHGLSEWTIKTDNAKQRFGHCEGKTKTISLSKYLIRLNDEARVTKTILHEVAHAICPTKEGHGPDWRRTALSIGSDAERCYSANNTITTKAPYNYECLKCSFTFGRFRIINPARLHNYKHAGCGGDIKQI